MRGSKGPKKKGGKRKIKREDKLAKELQTLPETETSAQAGSIQTLTQLSHKLKP